MKQLTASDISFYYRPSKCPRRFDCRRLGLAVAEPDPYQEVLKELGRRHEDRHRQTLEPLLDLSSGPMSERMLATRNALREGYPRIYQPVLTADAPFDSDTQTTGIPDFLLRESEGYVVRDCKTSRRINDKDHREILEQLDLYGWLLEANTGRPPVRLEVLAGDGTMHVLEYRRGAQAHETLLKAQDIIDHGLAGYEPVGWSKCQTCAYRQHCWIEAVEAKDPAVVYGVDQGTANTMHEVGVRDFRQLAERFTLDSLANTRKPRGRQLIRIGDKAAASILAHASALATNRIHVLKRPEIPASDSYVMFDLEGLPPQLDDTEKIYLWGMQVFGKKPGICLQAVADFGPDGDRNGWNRFLGNAAAVFRDHGDIPFVHWFRYEKDHVKKYIDRYGDPDGGAARVLANLCDLLVVTQESVVLPTYSYSIKQVEKLAGFKRTLEESGGAWSMAQYIKAVETEDAQLRKDVMDKILLYNREDLEATWAVLQWLKSL